MALNIFLLLVGLVVIIVSANILINTASSIAKRLGVSTFIIGITVVAFGTSAPEFAIGIMSGISKTNGLTLGNVIGSGVSNIAFILGLCAIIVVLPTKSSVIFREIPMLFGVELVLFGLVFFDGILSLVDGIILLLLFLLFLGYIVWDARKNKPIEEVLNNKETESADEDCITNAIGSADNIAFEINENIDNYVPITQVIENGGSSTFTAGDEKKPKAWFLALMLVLSCGGMFLGGNLTVDYSSKIAASLGLNEAFIGVTVVAIATTLPELMASVMAIRKKEADIVLGNCIGSNIFNILMVVGVSALVNPIEINNTMLISFAVFGALTLLVFLIAFFRKKIGRFGGIFLLSVFVLFLVYQILSVTVFTL